MKENHNTLKNGSSAYSLAAVLAGAALFAFLFISARYGVPSVDEADYCNLRFLQGDIPFVEWWDPMQLFWLAMAPVVGLYKLVAGSTDGLLLFMRYFYLTADALLYVFICRKLRAYRPAGLVSALLFCAVAPQTLFAVSYFTVAAFPFYAVCLLLIADQKKQRPWVLVLSGMALAVGIMSEPTLIIIYIIYIAAVCARELLKKRSTFLNAYGFVLDKRSALWLTLGAFLIFSALMAFLLAKGTFSRLGEMLPRLFGGVKYNGATLFSTEKLQAALRYYGAPIAIGFAVLLVSAAAVYFLKPPQWVRLALFAASCALAAVCLGRILSGVFLAKNRDIVYFINYHELPILVCAFIWYLLGAKKEPRLFALCAAAGLYSVAVDLASSSLLGTGGWLALLPAAECFFRLAREAFQLLKKAAQSKGFGVQSAAGGIAAALVCVCGAALVSWQGAFVGLETLNSPIEHYIAAAFDASGEAYAAELTAGPFKGIVTTRKIADVYAGALADLDQIKAEAEGGPVMIYGFTPFAYLYLDLPYGTHGAWYDGDLDRTLAYWETFPERKPRFIYFPLFDNLYWATPRDLSSAANRETLVSNIRTQLSVLGEFEVVYGESGVLLKVLP